MRPYADRVDTLEVALVERPDGLAVRYGTSNGDAGSVTVRYPPPVSVPAAMRPALGLGVAVYVAQLCLATRIRLNFAVARSAVDAIMPLAEMLYGIRRWKDELPAGPGPMVEAVGHCDPGPLPAATGDAALLLWSGGKDSTLSAALLAANGYERSAVHFSVNAGVEALELGAVTALTESMALDVLAVDVSFPQFLEFSTRYAVNWNLPPLCNTVPFGRDMLLCLLAAPVAAMTGSRFLSMGHDHECRTAYVKVGDERIPRNDVESAEGAGILERFVDTYVYSGVRLLPPVSGLSELRILREMFTRHPDLMCLVSFCFWGDNCGQCAKCLRYYLAQRLLGVEILSFRRNPLSEGGAPELRDVLDGDGNDVLFQEQILYCMGRLIQAGDVRTEESMLRAFGASPLYARVRPLLDDWESELMAVHQDVQLPADWHYRPPVTS